MHKKEKIIACKDKLGTQKQYRLSKNIKFAGIKHISINIIARKQNGICLKIKLQILFLSPHIKVQYLIVKFIDPPKKFSIKSAIFSDSV